MFVVPCCGQVFADLLILFNGSDKLQLYAIITVSVEQSLTPFAQRCIINLNRLYENCERIILPRRNETQQIRVHIVRDMYIPYTSSLIT